MDHDHGHHDKVYGPEFKRNWILRGGLHDLLHTVPFTSELVHYMFDKFWDNWDMDLYIQPLIFGSFGSIEGCKKKIYPYLADIYLSLHGSNPFETKDELEKGIISFMDGGPTWDKLSITFKHFINKNEVEAILQNRSEPKTPLLKYMKGWKLIYDRKNANDRITHAKYFMDLVIFLDQQGEAAWKRLDQAFREGKLTHDPDANPYKLIEIIENVI